MTLDEERLLVIKVRERIRLVIARTLVMKNEIEQLLVELRSLEAQLTTEPRE